MTGKNFFTYFISQLFYGNRIISLLMSPQCLCTWCLAMKKNFDQKFISVEGI